MVMFVASLMKKGFDDRFRLLTLGYSASNTSRF